MKNIELERTGNILTIVVNLDEDFGPSSSGKSVIVASTEGNAAIEGREERVGINVFRPLNKEARRVVVDL